MKQSIKGILKGALITAFIIAAALIWKDFITNIIHTVIPPGQQLSYQFLAAILATSLVVIAIYIIIKTSEEISKTESKIKKRFKK